MCKTNRTTRITPTCHGERGRESPSSRPHLREHWHGGIFHLQGEEEVAVQQIPRLNLSKRVSGRQRPSLCECFDVMQPLIVASRTLREARTHSSDRPKAVACFAVIPPPLRSCSASCSVKQLFMESCRAAFFWFLRMFSPESCSRCGVFFNPRSSGHAQKLSAHVLWQLHQGRPSMPGSEVFDDLKTNSSYSCLSR